MTAVLPVDGFADDPVASHSAQFPLARAYCAPGEDQPSEAGVRPWNLRSVQPVAGPVSAGGQSDYDPIRQVAVTREGVPVLAEPTANSVSSNDGDEGPSEDWTYDFTPDNPYST
ncbi:putative ATP-grasp target RiPP [Prauserella aidingensis]|uniref:putative ATP-grasp-modified RiPP n=1 Tax=Prauserella aidingensis TaxID=387890 RepID=UPI0020A505D5|nr:putative ATP-grasp-modified RiPP [Prauserella aidingensis]MCP2255165.1 putative ATP-grasp target RiPP [Prauserella aidingensis]